MKYKYKHKPNRIYFITDFEDNEIVEFAYDCEKPSAKAQEFAYYRNKDGITKLCAKDDLVPIKTNFDKITESVESFAEFFEINGVPCDDNAGKNRKCHSQGCKVCFKEWLQQEADNDNG